jgi:hypothetical protein
MHHLAGIIHSHVHQGSDSVLLSSGPTRASKLGLPLATDTHQGVGSSLINEYGSNLSDAGESSPMLCARHRSHSLERPLPHLRLSHPHQGMWPLLRRGRVQIRHFPSSMGTLTPATRMEAGGESPDTCSFNNETLADRR